MPDDVYDRLGLYDDHPTCPDCGGPVSRDEDGDGVMTMGYEFCENCGGDKGETEKTSDDTPT